MTSRIVKAVIVSPEISKGALGDQPEAGIADWLSRAHDDGLTLFLTAVSAPEIKALESWYTALGYQERENIRLLTPARFFWPRGVVKMPFEANAPDETLELAKGKLSTILASKFPGAVAELNHDDGYLAVVTTEPLPGDLIYELWQAAQNPMSPLAMINPHKGVEYHRTEASRSMAIIAPDKPSVIWFEAITVVERFAPDAVEIVGENNSAIEELRSQFNEAKKELTGAYRNGTKNNSTTTPIDESIIYAPRLAASSHIHFIKKWSDNNRRYVRESYWRATQEAHNNLVTAEDLLSSLDASKYARAATLVELAQQKGGSRVFDDFSGAVCFAPGFYEFELPKQTGDIVIDGLVSDLLTYFNEKLHDMPFDRPLLRRRLFSNSLILLRGEGYYANMKQTPPWERASDYIVEAKALETLFRKFRQQGANFNDAMVKCLTGGDATAPAWKLLLGAFDQARNLGLIMLGVGLHLWRESDKQFVDHSLLESSTQLVEVYFRLMLGDATLYGEEAAQQIIDGTIKLRAELESLKSAESERARSSDWYEPGRPIRGWREADNPYENLLVGLLASKSIDNKLDAAALGVFWGGTELPLAAQVAARARENPFKMVGFIIRGRYSSAAEQTDDFYCNLSTGQFAALDSLSGDGFSPILILDDNALSGQTLESARDLLLSAGVPRVETWTVRFSGERREGQMRMKDGGIVHPSYLYHRLRGYLGETPYARSYSRKQYASPVGVFNSARSRILRYLHNNGFASVFEREGF